MTESPAPPAPEETSPAPAAAPRAAKRRPYLVPLLGAGALFLLMLWQGGVFVSDKVAPGEEEGATSVSGGDSAPLTVEARAIPVVYRTVGTIRSRDEVELAPQITARILEIAVRGGDRVRKGQLLVRLDDREAESVRAQAGERAAAAAAALAAARQRVEGARAARELAHSELERTKQLRERQVATEQALEQAQSSARQAQAAERQAEEGERAAQAELAATEQAKGQTATLLAYTTIESPMDGVIAERLADPGDLAYPGRILLRLFDPARLMLEAPVRESLIRSVPLGATVQVEAPSLGQSFPGEIREVVPSVDPQSRSFLVKVCLGETPTLVPGMFGRLSLPLAETEEALLIPESAVQRTGQVEWVREATPAGPRPRHVRTVPAEEAGLRRVVSGLEAGDRIYP